MRLCSSVFGNFCSKLNSINLIFLPDFPTKYASLVFAKLLKCLRCETIFPQLPFCSEVLSLQIGELVGTSRPPWRTFSKSPLSPESLGTGCTNGQSERPSIVTLLKTVKWEIFTVLLSRSFQFRPNMAYGEPVTMDDLEAYAARHLDKRAYDYYATGADEDVTLHENRQAFRR